jgi:hypothetical protein
VEGFDDGWRRASAAVVLIVMALGLAVSIWVVAGRLSADPLPASSPFTVRPSPLASAGGPAATTPAASPSPSATVGALPSPSPSPSASAPSAGTVLFGGGPARGPWQQLGTVAEITHPGAPLSARYSYTNFWSDPAEEAQPDALWDQLVTEVTAQLVELGTPVDRPAFGGAPGSEPFNSFGGVQDIYVTSEHFTAQWSAIFEDDEGVKAAYFWFLIDADGEIAARAEPVMVTDDGSRTSDDNAEVNRRGIREWAASNGADGCASC